MKKCTLLAGLLLSSACAWAQGWQQPAAPEAMTLQTDADCYLYNVEAAGFYMGGYDWSTRACVNPSHGYKVRVERYVTDDVAWDNQSYYITSLIEQGAPAGQTLCLFVAGMDGLWVDRAKDAAEDKAFTFEDAGGGTFRIGLSPQNQEYNPTMFPGLYVGVVPSKGDTRLYVTNTTEDPDAQLTWQFVSPESYQRYVTALEQYEAATLLGTAIADAETRFPAVDIAAVKAVYANSASTAEQLTAARTQLTQLLLAHATPNHPVDVTAAIVNPSYDQNNNTGWTGTEPAFQYWGNAEFYNRTYDASQTVTGLQPGVYTAVVSAYYRAGNAEQDAAALTALANEEEAPQNARLYATTPALTTVTAPLPFASTGASDEALGTGTVTNAYGHLPNDMRTAAAYFAAGRYLPTSVSTFTTDGTLTMGLSKQVALEGDWTLFDDWHLLYLGNSDEAMQHLKTERQAAHPDYAALVAEGELLYYGQQEFDTYKQAVADLTAATTAAQITAALPAFETAAGALAENVTAYAAYAALYAETNDFLLAHQAEIMGDAVDALGLYLWEEDGPSASFPHPNGSALFILGNGNLTTEQVKAEMQYLQQLKDAALAEGMVDGMDCTALIKNPHFDTADGWTKEGLPEYPAGPENYRMGQAYTILFGVSQQISGLQNGLYELSLNDFFRPANIGSAEYTDNYRAYVLMNDFRQKMNSIESGAIENPDETAQQPMLGVGYVPNTLDEAAGAFQAGRYRQSLYGLVTDGTMKIQIRNDLRYEGCWAVWSDLKLTFRAKNPEVLQTVITDIMPSAQELLTEKCGRAELQALAQAIDAAQEAADEERYDALVALKHAMDGVTAGTEAYLTLSTALQNLQEAIDAFPKAKDIDAARALLAQTLAAMEAGELNTEEAVQKNDEVSAMVVAIKLGEGSGGEEQDFSNLIVNRNFDPSKGDKGEGRIDGWTTTAMNGYKEFTVSYNRAGFELYQDLSGLPKGKYKVTVHTYYRAGYWNEEEERMQRGEETHLTTLYAQTSADRAEKPVMNLTEGATTEAYHDKCYTLSSGRFAPDGTSPTAAWFAAGAYLNELEFTVPEDGKLRIGLSKTETFANDYEVVGEWSLYYYGDPEAVQREDYTALIVNPTFDPAKGDKGEGRIDGWTTTAMNGYKEFTVSYNRSGFELYQDLSGLPAGDYEVTVNTYYRAGYWNEEEERIQRGEETHLTTLYAQTSADRAEKPVMNLTEGATTESYHDKCYTLSDGRFAPDGTSPTAAWFAAGAYLNALQFTVPADGKVRIGLSKTETYANDYEVVGAWHLYYLGKGSGEDAIRGIATPAARLTTYDLGGRPTTGLRRGINIVRMADGSVRKVVKR